MFSWAKIFCAARSKKQLLDAASLCSLAMIYKWQSICYNRVSSLLTLANESHLLIPRLSASESGLQGYISCFVRQLNKDFLLAARILFCRISFNSLFGLWLSQFHKTL